MWKILENSLKQSCERIAKDKAVSLCEDPGKHGLAAHSPVNGGEPPGSANSHDCGTGSMGGLRRC